MRVTRKQITKPNSDRLRYSITELTAAQFETICKGLQIRAEEHADAAAAEMLKTFTELSKGEE